MDLLGGVLAGLGDDIVVGDLNVEPTKSLAWQNGFRLSSGLISKVLGH